MNKLQIILVLFFICNFSFSQTKEETIDWLNLKLSENTTTLMGKYKIEIKYINGYGDTILITKVTDVGFGPSPTYFSFLPKVISSVNTTTAYRTDGKLGVKLISKSASIYMDGEEFVNEIRIYFKATPDETVKRVQKGIIHLLNLMGNPITLPKELFKD